MTSLFAFAYSHWCSGVQCSKQVWLTSALGARLALLCHVGVDHPRCVRRGGNTLKLSRLGHGVCGRPWRTRQRRYAGIKSRRLVGCHWRGPVTSPRKRRKLDPTAMSAHRNRCGVGRRLRLRSAANPANRVRIPAHVTSRECRQSPAPGFGSDHRPGVGILFPSPRTPASGPWSTMTWSTYDDWKAGVHLDDRSEGPESAAEICPACGQPARCVDQSPIGGMVCRNCAFIDAWNDDPDRSDSC